MDETDQLRGLRRVVDRVLTHLIGALHHIVERVFRRVEDHVPQLSVAIGPNCDVDGSSSLTSNGINRLSPDGVTMGTRSIQNSVVLAER